MEEFTISEETEAAVRDTTLGFKEVADHIFVDSNTILKAVFVLDQIKSLEKNLDNKLGKSLYHAKYKHAKEKLDSILEAAEYATEKIRTKIYGWLINGNECEHAKLRKDGYEVIVDDASLVPRHFMKVDEKLIAEQAKELDGNIVIPGIRIKPKRTLVVKIKDIK